MLDGKVEVARAMELLFFPSLRTERRNALPQARLERLDVLAHETEASAVRLGADSAHDAVDEGYVICVWREIGLRDKWYFVFG